MPASRNGVTIAACILDSEASVLAVDTWDTLGPAGMDILAAPTASLLNPVSFDLGYQDACM